MGKANKPQRIFGTVRAFSERGTMLSKHDLESFSDSKTLEEFVTRLKNTSYVDSLSKIQQPCLLYTSPSPRDRQRSRMPSSA